MNLISKCGHNPRTSAVTSHRHSHLGKGAGAFARVGDSPQRILDVADAAGRFGKVGESAWRMMEVGEAAQRLIDAGRPCDLPVCNLGRAHKDRDDQPARTDVAALMLGLPEDQRDTLASVALAVTRPNPPLVLLDIPEL